MLLAQPGMPPVIGGLSTRRTSRSPAAGLISIARSINTAR